jgi:hypothetical protein
MKLRTALIILGLVAVGIIAVFILMNTFFYVLTFLLGYFSPTFNNAPM